MKDRIFYSWAEKALRAQAKAVLGARLQGATPITIADAGNPADTLSGKGGYELFGPGDIRRLTFGAITRRFPSPGAQDAEETKLALVELGSPDLPWRYTPQVAGPKSLRPWLVLVVGRRGPDEITVRPDGHVTLGTVVQAAHPLVTSADWAHVHQVGTTPDIARILSPAAMLQEKEYVACVVPAFTPDGADSWSATASVTLPCYDTWSFRTGPEGDFRVLASKLEPADLDVVEETTGKPFGEAAVNYRGRGYEATGSVLVTAGALKKAPPAGSPETALPSWVEADVSALSEPIVSPDGRPVITAPQYHEPFVAPELDGSPGGWIDQLTTDPRRRGMAGLGAWAAIAWQDRISDAAARKCGDLQIARDRIGHLALGLEAARSLWRRHVPADPVRRLATLSPVLGRLPAPGGTVLSAIAGRTPLLARALFSSAARRALRPGPARNALAADGATRLPAVLGWVAQCPPPPPDPGAIGSGRVSLEEQRRAVEDAIRAAARPHDAAAQRAIDELLGDGGVPDGGHLVAVLTALNPGGDRPVDEQALDEVLRGGEFPRLPRPDQEIPPVFPSAPCRSVDLSELGRAVGDAVDPTVERPVIVDRVLKTLPGLTHIGPIELEPELDLPLWSFLESHQPDWLLPGVDGLPEHSVVGLSTNPGFVQAMLAGANKQTTGELRWRNIPLRTGWSPLRKFWQRKGGDLDIAPIKTWPAASGFGEPQLETGHGEEAVVVFKTPLFRRYPATVVYLCEAQPNWPVPDPDVPLSGRIDPTFVGTIGPDVTFFGFPLTPSELATRWVVLEEPPAGYRFYEKNHAEPPEPKDTSAAFAYRKFAVPVRVLIGKLVG